MKCRKNLRKLIQAYNAASPADKPNTELIRFRNAVVALKSAPSRLAPPHTQANRYDDYVYIHQQSMAGHPSSDPGPHPGHRGPAFFPWHREFLRQFQSYAPHQQHDAAFRGRVIGVPRPGDLLMNRAHADQLAGS